MLDSFLKGTASVLNLFLQFILGIYNMFVGQAVGMLGQDPAAWNTTAWTFVEGANDVFLGVAAVLVVIFFLMGFCADSIDIHQDMRLEQILRMFIKLSIAELFVVNSLTIVKKMFSLGSGLVQQLSGSDLTFEYAVAEEVSAILSDPLGNGITGWDGGVGLILLLILSVVFMLLVTGCAFLILYEAFVRFFKILMLVPYGTLANSTLAGNKTLTHSAVSFWKYALETILSAVTMYMALALSASVLSSGTLSLTAGWSGGFYVLGWMLESTFTCMLTLGTVKGAEQLTQKALGL